MTGFESFVGIDPWTALFTFCNMMITFAVLKKFLFKPVKKMIDDRQAEIDTMYADADAAKQKAAELEQEYQQVTEQIQALLHKQEQLDTDLKIARASAESLADQSTAELEQNIADIEETNRKVRANLDKDKAEEDAKEYRAQYNTLTTKIEAVRKQKGGEE